MAPTKQKYIILDPPKNGVLLIRYNKPESGNSLHSILLKETVEAIQWAHTQPDLRIIVLTGEGKFFCTGMELVNQDGMSFAVGSDFHQLNKLLILSDKVLVAAVNGPARLRRNEPGALLSGLLRA